MPALSYLKSTKNKVALKTFFTQKQTSKKSLSLSPCLCVKSLGHNSFPLVLYGFLLMYFSFLNLSIFCTLYIIFFLNLPFLYHVHFKYPPSSFTSSPILDSSYILLSKAFPAFTCILFVSNNSVDMAV